MKSFINWIYGFALAIGGPGLFAIAFLDSSFVSLPQINDILVVLMVTKNKAWMPYYALMATLGSIAGCYVIYYLAEKGGEAFLRKRLRHGHTERALATLQAPRPAGADDSRAASAARALQAVRAAGRRRRCPAAASSSRPSASRAVLRYLVLGMLAIWYGDLALEYMRTHGRVVALSLVGVIVAGRGRLVG